MKKGQNLVVVGAKINLPKGIDIQESFEMEVLGLVNRVNGKIIKEYDYLGTEKAEQYLEKSLKSVDPKKIPFVYIKGYGQPAYLIHVIPETKPKEELERNLKEKYLPRMFDNAMIGTEPETIQPLSKTEQEIIDRWFAGRKN